MSENRKFNQYKNPLLTCVSRSTLTLVALFSVATLLPSCSDTPSTSSSPAPSGEAAASSSSSSDSAATSPQSEAPKSDAAPAEDKGEMTKEIEEALISTLASQVPSPITAANCPKVEKLEAGKTFDCETTIAEGNFLTTVTIKDTEGGIRFNPKNLVATATLEKTFVEAIKTKDKLDAKVTCGNGKVIILKTVGEKLECQVAAGEKAGTATATVLDLAGKVKTEWKINK